MIADSESVPCIPRSHCVLLALLILAATLLRFHHIASTSLWMDEIMSLQIASGWGAGEISPPRDEIQPRGVDLTGIEDQRPVSSVLGATARDTHPPLYFLLLRFWCRIFGTGDKSVRALSAILSALGIFAFYDAARWWHGPAVALWAAALMAVATPQILYAQEARSYAMLGALLLFQLSAMARIQAMGVSRWRVGALALSTMAALTTHYIAIPAMLAMMLYASLELRGPSRQAVMGIFMLAGAFFAGAWGPTLWSQRFALSSNLAWTADDGPGLAGRTLARLAALPIKLFIAPAAPNSPSLWIGSVFYLAALLAWSRRELRMWVLLAAAIIGATAASDLFQHRKAIENVRFTLAASPALFAIAAAVGSRLKSRWAPHLVPAVFVFSCIYGLPAAYDPAWKPNARLFVRELDAQVGPDDLLIVPYLSREQDWYSSVLLSTVTHYSAHPHRPILALSRPISDEAAASASTMSGAWTLNLDRSAELVDFLPGAISTATAAVPYVGSLAKVEIPPPSIFPKRP